MQNKMVIHKASFNILSRFNGKMCFNNYLDIYPMCVAISWMV